MTNCLLETSPFSTDGGALIGRDPRTITAEDWRGRPLVTGLAAVRAKCLDCAHNSTEVRKCIQTDCPLWPLRMGSVPKGLRKAAHEASCVGGRSGAPTPHGRATCNSEAAMEGET